MPRPRALDVVAGYTCVNDVSAWDLQFADGQRMRGKSLDTFCPLGVVTLGSELGDPQALSIRCVLNGELVQSSRTAEMLFGVAELIEFATQAVTPEPGDVIATPAPAGLSVCRDLPRFLRPGDVVMWRSRASRR